jgi:hydroxycarboxylate dehydrogenase B
MATDAVSLTCEALRDMMCRVFDHHNVSPQERDTVVDTLLEASLSGYHSHGIMRVPMYAEGIRQGSMVPDAVPTVLNETESAIHLDANFGLGPVTAVESVARAVDKAGVTGVGCVSVINANDVARLGSYMAEPALRGYIALILVNDAGGNPAVAPWGGTEAFLSTNPLAAGIPWSAECPIVIDMSTSVAAAGKLKTLNAQGLNAPEGWLIDRSGHPTITVAEAVTMPPEHALLPLGGLVAGHKGFALSLLVDVLAGAISGAGCSSGAVTDTERNGLFILALDPDKFVGRRAFHELVEKFVTQMKETEKVPGVDEILVPGERAHRERTKRRVEGIPIELPILNKVIDVMKESGIPYADIPGLAL